MTTSTEIKKANALFKLRTMICDDLFKALGKANSALNELSEDNDLYAYALKNYESIDKKHYEAVLLQRSAGEKLQNLEMSL